MSWTEELGSAEIHLPATLAQLRNALIDEWNNIPCELSMLWLTLSKGELGQQWQQEGGTPDIDFQFDFVSRFWGVATNELQ